MEPKTGVSEDEATEPLLQTSPKTEVKMGGGGRCRGVAALGGALLTDMGSPAEGGGGRGASGEDADERTDGEDEDEEEHDDDEAAAVPAASMNGASSLKSPVSW